MLLCRLPVSGCPSWSGWPRRARCRVPSGCVHSLLQAATSIENSAAVKEFLQLLESANEADNEQQDRFADWKEFAAQCEQQGLLLAALRQDLKARESQESLPSNAFARVVHAANWVRSVTDHAGCGGSRELRPSSQAEGRCQQT